MSPHRIRREELPYSGLRVLDLAGRTAPHCGQILGLFGADVLLEDLGDAPPLSDPLWIAYNAGKAGLARQSLGRNRRAALESLAPAVDVLIEGDDPLPDFDPCERNPRLIHVITSPFGPSGPRAHFRSSELIAQAAGGILCLSGDRGQPPARIGIPLALSMLGANAACAVLLALHRRSQTGRGARIDVSQQEAVANLHFTNAFMAHHGQPPGSRGESPLTASGKNLTRKLLWQCADGYATWTLWTGPGMGPKNRQTFEWMREAGVPEADELLEIPWHEMGTGDLTPELLETVNRSVGAFFRGLSKAVINREAVARRILLQALETPADILQNDQLLARDAFRSLELPGGGTAKIGGVPLRSSAYAVEVGRSAAVPGSEGDALRAAWNTPAPTPDSAEPDAPPLPFSGLRVLDLGWAVVSPVLTKYLAIFGADVIKLELRKRPDPTRMTGPYPLGRPSMDGSATFVSVNASKRSVGLDLTHPDARRLVLQLARRADVISENFTAGVAERLGYGYDAFREARRDVIMLSLSMQGQTGPRAAHPGLGNHLQAMCGIDALTGFPGGPPGGPNQVMPDFVGPWVPLAGILAALEHRRRTGEGQYIDVSQLEAILLYVQPRLIECATNRASPERFGNASPTASPHGVYPVRGEDRWIAIAVQSDNEWRQLRELLTPAERERFPTSMTTRDRLDARTELDAAVARFSADRDGEELMNDLQEIGIAAYTVNNGLEMIADPQLAHRAHYRPVEHPKLGDLIADAPAFRFDDLEPHIVAGPMYAADTSDVMKEWLGLDDDALAGYVASGVLDF